ncbi:MAG TPA: hypothetical protein VJY62_18790 [Bacteroidia bacterium]|nr:hypothetical protein [Bacteroidia bacterium]
MKKHLLLLFIFLLLVSCVFPLFAGNESIQAGGRSAGVAGAAVTYSDIWSAFHNQAGLANLKKFSAGAFNETPFLLSELSTRGVAVALPVSDLGVFAVSMNYYGFNLYNEKKIGLAYAKSFGEKISAAIQIDYLGTSISEGYGSNSAFTVEAGFRAQVLPKLFLGAHVFNPTRAKLADYDKEKIPTVLKGGLSYLFSDKVTVSIESEKNMDADNIFKAGVEYHIVKVLFVRGGISTNPTKTAFGFGIDLDSFKFDIAASYHQQLGYTPNVSLTYSPK